MSFQITVSGHTEDQAEEAKVLDAARKLVSETVEAGGQIYTASFSSQYHKSGDLRDAPEVVQSSDSQEN